MKLKNNIREILREGFESTDDQDVTTVVSDKDALDSTLKSVSREKKMSGGDYEVAVMDEAEDLEEGEGKVHTSKFDRCVDDVKAKGEGDSAYPICQASLGAGAIQKDHRTKPADEYDRTDRQDEAFGDDYEAASRGADYGEAGASDYEEMEKLKQAAAIGGNEYVIQYWKYTRDDDYDLFDVTVKADNPEEAIKAAEKYDRRGKRFSVYSVNGQIVESTVVGKMTKGALEKLVESKTATKKRIIKIGDIRNK